MANPSNESRSFWPSFQENRLFTVLVALLLLAASVFFILLSRNNLRQYSSIGLAPINPSTITVDGTGKITSPPTVAMISLGVMTDGGTTISTIQKDNTTKMNTLLDAMKALGIASADLQTANYNIYPRYEYPNGKSVLVGYSVNQSVNVKVRDLAKVSDVFQKAGELGANQVSGPDFTIDDPQGLKENARVKAIQNAQDKANVLAKSLGVHLVRVVSFSESGDAPQPIMYDTMKAMAPGIGGGAVAQPAVEAGTLDVVSNVSITYEID